MRRSWMAIGTMAVVGAGMAMVLAALPGDAQPKMLMVARKAAAPPAAEPALDAGWRAVEPLTVKLNGGRNLPGGSTEVTLRAQYTADMVYFLVQYKDPTESFKRSPWVKEADGSWKKAKDPADKGGDNNLVYEDKFGVIWNISSPAFEQRGCMGACHVGEGKPYGNKYLPSPNERADMWHWKSVRTGSVGQIDDQYLDGTRYDAEKSPNAGRKNEPKTGGGYTDNVSEDKKGPRFALPGNKPAPPYWILDAEKTPVDAGAYKPGAEVPSIIVAPFTGDRGDVTAKSAWKDGVWTIAIARKRVTGSEFDVQFDDPKRDYAFGVAVFDNAQVRHAFHTGVLKLKFE